LSLENKFFCDLSLDVGMKSDSDILHIVEDWPTSYIRDLQIRENIIQDEQKQSYPFVTLFVLFMIGQHKLALKYLKDLDCPPFFELYSDYVTKYSCSGVP
jgi:hypothetical protein